MTIDQAMKIIEQNLSFHIKPVPPALLKRIKNIVISTRTIVQKEIILENRLEEKPDLQKEWLRICSIYKIDPVECKKGRHYDKIRVKVHFVRHILLNYKFITLVELSKFLNMHHTSVICLRDRSKAECPIPPFYQRKRGVIFNQRLR